MGDKMQIIEKILWRYETLYGKEKVDFVRGVLMRLDHKDLLALLYEVSAPPTNAVSLEVK